MNAGHLPGIWDIAGVVAQNGVHDGRHELGGYQVRVLALVHKGFNEAQRALLHLQASQVWSLVTLRKETDSCTKELALYNIMLDRLTDTTPEASLQARAKLRRSVALWTTSRMDFEHECAGSLRSEAHHVGWRAGAPHRRWARAKHRATICSTFLGVLPLKLGCEPPG